MNIETFDESTVCIFYLTHRNIIFNILEQFSKKNHMLGLSGTSSYAVFVYLYFLYLRADMMQNHICWHLFACSPLCVIKCTLKLPTWANANSHWLHLSDFWDCLPGQLYIHNYCTCLLFLHYEFLNVSSDFLLEQMQNHNGCICLTFLHCLLTNVFYQQLGGCIYVALYISIVCIMPTIEGISISCWVSLGPSGPEQGGCMSVGVYIGILYIVPTYIWGVVCMLVHHT